MDTKNCDTIFPFGYERVYLPLYNVADTPFDIQGDDMCWWSSLTLKTLQ